GLSQGHSDAVRRVEGVKQGVQYTLPSEEAIESVRRGENPKFTKSDSHKRECYVVLEDGADEAEVERSIKTMPHYFADYDTTVHFITEEQMRTEHNHMPHGGFVIRSGESEAGNNQIVEFSLKLNSNPEFTASVLVAYARAAHRMHADGIIGSKMIYNFKSETSFGGKGKPSINEVSLFYLKGLRIFEFSELYKCFLVFYESTYATLDPVLWSIIGDVIIFYLVCGIVICHFSRMWVKFNGSCNLFNDVES